MFSVESYSIISNSICEIMSVVIEQIALMINEICDLIQNNLFTALLFRWARVRVIIRVSFIYLIFFNVLYNTWLRKISLEWWLDVFAMAFEGLNLKLYFLYFSWDICLSIYFQRHEFFGKFLNFVLQLLAFLFCVNYFFLKTF